jgi:hypothetical protein
MTTDHQMAMKYAAQDEVIVALRFIGESDLAGRLERCMTARRERRGGDGWPFTCRSAACFWCCPAMNPIMPVRHVPMVGSGDNVEPCHRADRFVGWLA